MNFRLLLAVGFCLGLSACRKAADLPLDSFVIHPEFELALVASEPLVLDPVEMHFDRNGDAYVLEMPGYPFGDDPSRLVRLKDQDGDGIYDGRQVFSAELGVASSFLPYRNGFLVASPPQLIWIADRDGDGEEDHREVLLEGFSNDNLQHNFNGLAYGLDNWIYIANGGNSGTPHLAGQPDTQVPMRGGDLRLRGDFGEVARVGESSGGYKLTFDAWGHLFETHNLEHNLHLLFEDRYLEEVPGSPGHSLVNISDHETDGLSRIYPIGEQESRVNHPEQSGYFSGSCGITYYGGARFPEFFQNGLFVADVVLNLVHFDQLRDSLSGFATSRYGDGVEFLASTDRAFRPVNFTVGPEGSLFVMDMHRDVIEHPEWIPDALEKDLDLEAGKDKGRIYRIRAKTPTAPLVPWDFDSTEGLVLALGNPNQWVRLMAQQILVGERQMNSVAALEGVVRGNEAELHRMHALWTLEGLGQLSDSLLLETLKDSSPGVREHVIKISETRMGENRAFLAAILDRCSDTNPRVRLRAVLALASMRYAERTPEAGVLATTLAEVLDQDVSDPWVTRVVAGALLPQATPFLKTHVRRWEATPAWNQVLNTLSEHMGQGASPEEIASVLEILRQGQNPAPLQEYLLAVATGWEGFQRTESAQGLQATLRTLEMKSERPMVLALARFRKAVGLQPSTAFHRMLSGWERHLRDTTLGPSERLEWLELAGLLPMEGRWETLQSLLDAREPLSMQREALRQLEAVSDPRVPELLLPVWNRLGPEARRMATNILLYNPSYHESLVQAMEEGSLKLGEFNLDLERRRTLLFSPDSIIRMRAEKLFSDAGVVQRRDVLEQFRPSLSMEYNRDQGREVFQNLCASCHQVGALGTPVGPALTEIGRKSRETLLHDILDPNAAADVQYLAHSIEDANGMYFSGVVVSETEQQVVLKLMGGEERTFRKDRIRQFTSSGQSFMPEGLEQGMSLTDMANLLAFLQDPK